MTLADRVKKITKPKPFYATAGAGDYAVENLRELRKRLQKQLRAHQGEVRETAKELPGKARETVVKSLPEQAREYADTTTAKVTELHDDLAARGPKIVSTMSREAAKESAPTSRSRIIFAAPRRLPCSPMHSTPHWTKPG
ncbi:hypothetical protein [Sphaerisporangium perillae]|uniref:hypothetical protein n=1 Tax=Sphaerisporangium perillae TaxID=2935860 RepID=UPI00200EEC7D|nr:hypothetical protein [Sphaerisporangium perillae]